MYFLTLLLSISNYIKTSSVCPCLSLSVEHYKNKQESLLFTDYITEPLFLLNLISPPLKLLSFSMIILTQT